MIALTATKDNVAFSLGFLMQNDSAVDINSLLQFLASLMNSARGTRAIKRTEKHARI